jgi:post-segregation antitoxin (ccd killing protein)
MAQVLVTLPDELAERANDAGLLSDGAIRVLLEDAVRRHAATRFLELAEQLHAAALPPMTDDDILAEVAAYRADKRAGIGDDTSGS